ncbi:bile acid:sodium symporter family protein [Oceanicoccus sp. KOV_DT_Chl]|uniref:bile acid:sodium symporter family protein n=1 Tax=Oceanicoccus sp. KOV_DT_Chl TaxID=1904639 RepID=UPI0011AF3CDC|nr:bile acid:sodium symporter [Oceanicoccus sp. KOV_DT_Chl]
MNLNDLLVNLIVPLSLFVVMAIIGMDLTKEDFKRIALYPKAILVGTGAQLITLPLLAAAIIFTLQTTTFALSPENIGTLIIFAACPGGGISNIMTALARGNVALSVSYTATSSMLGLITIPLIAAIGFDWFLAESTTISVPLAPMIGQLILLVFAPIAVGMWLKSNHPNWIANNEKNFSRMTNVLILIIVSLSFMVDNGITAESLENALPAALAFTFGSILLGLIITRLAKLNKQDSIALLIEFSVRHAGIATLIIIVILQRFDMMALMTACAIIQLLAVLLIVAAIRGFSKPTEVASE